MVSIEIITDKMSHGHAASFKCLQTGQKSDEGFYRHSRVCVCLPDRSYRSLVFAAIITRERSVMLLHDLAWSWCDVIDVPFGIVFVGTRSQ